MRHRFALMLPVLLAACDPAADSPATPVEPYPSRYQALPSGDVLLRNATVLVGDGTRLEAADVLLSGGRISAVGEDLEHASGETIDATGRWITPGLIDVHSHLGVYPTPGTASHQDGNEMTGAVTAEVWAEHSVWPQDPGFATALAGGVTSLQVLPGSANLIGGRSVTLKNIPGRSVMEMKFPGAPHGLKMACGENPKNVYGSQGQAPATRMGNVAGFRAAWAKAAQYRKDRDEAARGEGEAPARDLQLETMALVLDGEILVHNHCYRADEMAVMLDLAREFDFRITAFHHAVEAYKISDLLAEAGTCSAVWADWWGFKMEALDGIRENAALLDRAGACAIIHSDSAAGIQRLNQETAKVLGAAARAGIDIAPERAIMWLTLNAAQALGIDDETGTLAAGKMADVVVWNGNPFSGYAAAERVYVDGALAFSRGHDGVAPVTDFSLGQSAALATDAASGNTSEGGRPAPKPELLPYSDASRWQSAHQRMTAAFARLSEAGRDEPAADKTAPDDGDPSGSVAASPAYALIGARVHTVGSAGTLASGTLVVADGKIRSVVQTAPGAAEPDGTIGIDASGLIVTPAFFAPTGQIGLGEIGYGGDPGDALQRGDQFTAGFDIADAFNPRSLQVTENRVEGVLHAVLVPAPGEPDQGHAAGHVLSGMAAIANLGAPETDPARGVAVVATLGENGSYLAGGSRTAALLELRAALDDARDYRQHQSEWRAGARREYRFGPEDLETLVGVLERRVPLLVNANRASDIRAVLELARVYNVRVVIQGGAEAWLEAEALAAAAVPVILSPLINLPNTFDHLYASRGSANALASAGVAVAFTDYDAEGHNARNLRQVAGNAVADGMDWELALRAITRTPAEIFGVADSIGSLEPGRQADFVVWASDPLEPGSFPVAVVSGGRMLPLATRQTALRNRYLDAAGPVPPAWRSSQ